MDIAGDLRARTRGEVLAPRDGGYEAARAAYNALLVFQRCPQCEANIYYPRIVCPRCWHRPLAWVESTGRGTVYSYATIHRAESPVFLPLLPMVLAAVQLEDGPMVIAGLRGCDPDSLEIGMAVQAQFIDRDSDTPLLTFAVASRARLGGEASRS